MIDDNTLLENIKSSVKKYTPIKKRIEELSSGGIFAKWRNRFEIAMLQESCHKQETVLIYSFMEYVNSLEAKESTIYDLKSALEAEMSKDAADIDEEKIDNILKLLDELDPFPDYDVEKSWQNFKERYLS